MKRVSSEPELAQLLKDKPAVMLLFGGKDCGVCQVVKPKLAALVRDEFPQMEAVYIDCQEAQALCAAQAVFSLPVLQLWFEGKRFDSFVKVFSLGSIREAVERPYGLLFGPPA
ncbi:thioredoxin family protein [Granulosicoccaceae sp. 1_MG-2023]|nr:thioredoxin family protein [Granulosicoccaceae sp. 1_MG-2023]